MTPDVLGKISQTLLVAGSFSFIAAAVCLMVAGVATGPVEKLVNVLFFVFAALFLLSLAALPVVAIAYIWT